MANVLIVDDSLTVAKSIEAIVRSGGHTAMIAFDTDEASRKLETHEVDVMILDVVMPGKNGFQFCREMKAHPQYKKIPIIMMSTKNTDIDRFWGRKQGADEYLCKPAEPLALLTSISRLVTSDARIPRRSSHMDPASEAGSLERVDSLRLF